MKEYNESQYDDDLTVGSDDYDDSSYSDPVDLFEFSTSEEAPISRLKSLVLSIDWEITDEVLLQFNEELNDLKGIWAGEKINLVYVQALEKISKYIFQHKADSHPNAIKLLLTLYYNLEKIVSSEEISEAEKKVLLIEDVKRFEALKKHIAKHSTQADPTQFAPEEDLEPEAKEEGVLFNLKAIVYAIDWEITDKDLDDLREEVVKLEKTFVGSKPKLILLQGIGTLGVYIKVKKSDAHADAFKLLHLFYESLEKIVDGKMSFEAEKAVLLPAVNKFNEFKSMLGSTVSPGKVSRSEDDGGEDSVGSQGPLAPAFSDISEEESKGFQAEEEAQNFGEEASTNVVSHIDDFFGDSVPRPGTAESSDTAPSGKIDSSVALEGVNVAEDGDEEDELSGGPVAAVDSTEDAAPAAVLSDVEDSPIQLEVDKDAALQGVDVESEADDDSDEEALPQGTDGVAPALVANEEVGSAFSETNLEDPAVAEDDVFSEISGTLEGFFGSDDETPPPGGVTESLDDDSVSSVLEPAAAEGDDTGLFSIDRDIALQGVDVETEADDDTDEESLPVEAGALAPALADNEEVSSFSEATVEDTLSEDSEIQKITGKLDGFFGEEEVAMPAEDGVADLQTDQQSVGESSAVVNRASSGEELDDFFDDSVLQEGDRVAAVTDPESIDDAIEVELSEEPTVEETVFEEDEVVTFFETDEAKINETVSEESILSPAVEETAQSFDLTGTTTMPATEQSFAEKEVVFELADERGESENVVAGKAGVYMPPKVRLKPTLLGPYTAVKGSGVDDNVSDRGPFEALCTCADAFEIELEDRCFDEFNKEMNGLSSVVADKPVEKTMLQLLSTVVQHVDHFRAEADGRSLELLKSISTTLGSLHESDLSHNQELLLSETVKVLNWQQGLITQTAVRKDNLAEVDTAAGGVASELAALRATFKSEISELRDEIKELLSS